jgi:hypothetical protein
MSFAIQASAQNAGEDMGFAMAIFCFLRALGTVSLSHSSEMSTEICFVQHLP